MGVEVKFPALASSPLVKDQITGFSTVNDVTTRNVGDYSGGVGQTTVSAQSNPNDVQALSGMGEEVIVYVDGTEVSRGRVRDMSPDATGVTLTADTITARFNANVTAYAHVGTLASAMNYYSSLVGGGIPYAIDTSIANRSIAWPGTVGNLWDHLKQAMSAEQLEIVVLAGVVHVRPLRTQVYTGADFTGQSMNVNNQGSSRAVKVHYYGNYAVQNSQVYPWGISQPTVYTVDEGETITFTVTLRGSLNYVRQPVAVDTINLSTTGSVGQYAISGSDGAPVPAAAWIQYEGRLSVRLLDHQTLEVTIRGMESGTPWPGPYRIAESSGETAYSALYVMGDGLRTTDQEIVLTTGATTDTTGQEFGVEITNPFIRTLAQAYDVGVIAAGKTEISVSHSGGTSVADAPSPGDRILYRNGYYRVTSVTIDESRASYSAEQDTILADVSAKYAGRTLADFAAANLRTASLVPLGL